MDGPIVGTSLPKSLNYGFMGISRFEFAASLPLVAGNTYVIEVVVAPGGGNVALGGGMNSYGQGRAILAGQPVPASDDSDLWFREGTHRRMRR